MRFHFAGLVLAACLFHALPAHADHQPAVIVPGNPEVPVVIDGYNVSWGVAEGDWGLYRAGHGTPVFISSSPVFAPYGRPRHYFPSAGKEPRSGRYEVIPPANRALPKPAQTYQRSWTTPAAPPTTITEYPGFVPPPIILSPKGVN